MQPANELPMPELVWKDSSGISFITDDGTFEQTGVRIAFTTRIGGCSEEPYKGLNLGAHVGDDPESVAKNRSLLLEAISCDDATELITLNQVHGNNVIVVDSDDPSAIEQVRDQGFRGADGIVVDCTHVAALLCFADCMPVILVAPTGAFAVVHAGWRGVMAKVSEVALAKLLQVSGPEVRASDINAYIGPYIHSECFEVSTDIADQFEEAFGASIIPAPRHVDLGRAVKKMLLDCGLSERRIADSGHCTICENDAFFSYRAENGVCGRHAAIAFRK